MGSKPAQQQTMKRDRSDASNHHAHLPTGELTNRQAVAELRTPVLPKVPTGSDPGNHSKHESNLRSSLAVVKVWNDMSAGAAGRVVTRRPDFCMACGMWLI
jgi:hypothetical protein